MSEARTASRKKRKSEAVPQPSRPFAAIMRAPVFLTSSSEKNKGAPWYIRSIAQCDSCKTAIAGPVVSSYEDPGSDLCVSCYNKLRKEMTSQETLDAYKSHHAKSYEDFYAANKTKIDAMIAKREERASRLPHLPTEDLQ